MNLVYNPKSTHIKCDGAVIGKVNVTSDGKTFTATIYGQSRHKMLKDRTLIKLLAKVRAILENKAERK